VPAYDESWGTSVISRIPTQCTHLLLAFASIKNGKFVASDVAINSQTGKDLQAAQARGVKVLVAVGGASGANGWKSIANATAVADEMLQFVSKNRLNGIDLDVEGNMKQLTPNMMKLVQELRRKGPMTLLITWAGWMDGAESNDYTHDSIKLMQAVGNEVDFVNVMTYIFDKGDDPIASVQEWGKLMGSPHKVSIGLCNDHPDCNADNGGFATVALTKSYAVAAVTNSFGGVMFWNDNLQASSGDNDGLTVLKEDMATLCKIEGFC
jgi:chitinase